jgi:hypothetical protein
MRFGRSRRSGVRGTTAVRIIVILVAVGCCLAGAAYAASRRAAPESSGDRTPLRPRIILHPEEVTPEPVAEFDFAQPARPAGKARPGLPLGYECRLDAGEWEDCEGPVYLTGIGRGNHRFAVRAVNRAGTEGPVSSFEWRRTKPSNPAPSAEPVTPVAAVAPEAPIPPALEHPVEKPTEPETPVTPPVEPPVEPPIEPPENGTTFTIEQVGELEDLFPGAPAQPIDLRIVNPNPEAISVVSLTATIATDPPGCPAAENFALAPATVSAATPLVVAAESSATLPAGGIEPPTIAMLEQPYSQDACQAAELTIDLSGEGS